MYTILYPDIESKLRTPLTIPPRTNLETTMNRQQATPVRLDLPMVMLAGLHTQELVRRGEERRLANLARTGDSHKRSPVSLILAWVRAKLLAILPGRHMGSKRATSDVLSQANAAPQRVAAQ
jgi:hypothetical protein